MTATVAAAATGSTSPSQFARFIRAEQDADRLRHHLDPEVTAALIVAATDGLQTQWMLDPSFDMVEHIEKL